MSGPKRSRWISGGLLAIAFLLIFAMVALGNWQLRRLAWKQDLISTVSARAYAPAVSAPTTPTNAATHEYLRVSTHGYFQHEHQARVKALTALGAGFWLMTPLVTDTQTVWVNRGFVPTGTTASEWWLPTHRVTVHGLVRITEPDGTWLENNDPSNDRWFSRDIAALTEATNLRVAADYFIDADHAAAADAWPRGGLTRLTFRNTHWSYAMTWYAMAALLAGALAYVVTIRER